MKVITHTIHNGLWKMNIDIAEGHAIPPHSQYYGVLHGAHDGVCECEDCYNSTDSDDWDVEEV